MISARPRRYGQALLFILYRLSSNFFPWGGKYKLEDLPTYEGIKEALARAGAVARATGQRLTAHPSEFVKLAAPRPELVEESLADLELHGSVRHFEVANIALLQADVVVIAGDAFCSTRGYHVQETNVCCPCWASQGQHWGF